MAGNERKRIVVVTGDVTIDWNIARLRRSDSSGLAWKPADLARACSQRGGAALLGELIHAVGQELAANGGEACDVLRIEVPAGPSNPADDRYHHSYALWAPFKYSEKPDREDPAWRVADSLGTDRSEQGWRAAALPAGSDDSAADLLVLDDADLGFRDHPDVWPSVLEVPQPQVRVLVKVSQPIARGPLWDRLLERCADRLTVVLGIDALRRTEVQVSHELSWERTAQDVLWELVHNPRVNGLSRCAHVIVTFDTAGALLLERGAGGHRCRLFFDPKAVEGMWSQAYPGGMIGYGCCFTAAIARQLMLSPDEPDVARGIRSGLAAMRKLHLEGYGQRKAKQPQLFFPVDVVVPELAKDTSQFAAAEVEDPVRHLGGPERPVEDRQAKPLWSILRDRYPEGFDALAERVVTLGPDVAFSEVPLGQFGGLLTVDRQEIESFRSVRSLVAEYIHQTRQKRPLSIAVFGAPGSGKSFGVTEVAKALAPGLIRKLEFNLSQLAGPDALQDALHQVRDVALGGSIPLVFWDEFDTALDGQPLGWLRHFLAPMQDGAFQQGQVTHPIGPAVFVFAGGTCERLEAFGGHLAPEGFRAAKGPDFVSRLKGFINILGPNPRGGEPAADPCYVIRRAILLRSLLSRGAPQLISKRDGKDFLNIDPGLLRAFLRTRTYRHGARSMESVIAMSQLADRSVFERSCLPSEAQLGLHVDGLDFLALVQEIVLTPELLERLACAAHEVFVAGKQRDGWRLGVEKSAEQKTHPLLVEYDVLPEWAKDANRVNVRTIPQKLAAAGYVMIPARSNETPLEFPGDDLEALARLEHRLWLEAKLAAGWTRGTATAEEPQRSEYLVSWEDLPEEIRQIDRDLVRGIPRILARAGYAIAGLHAHAGAGE